MSRSMRRAGPQRPSDPVAGNGLLDRRALLGRGLALAGTVAAGAVADSAGAEPLAEDPWSREPGAAIPAYGAPSRFEKAVIRTLSNPQNTPRTSHARTPHQHLDGMITPNPLHFVIARSGSPDIDPAKHRLLIHGLVKRPLVFSYESLLRYPMESRVSFIECGGNGAPLYSPKPIQADVQALFGLLSCAEWTGVKLSVLLDEAGIDSRAKWFTAEGGDSEHMQRSIPLAKALDDAMVVLYQNGEKLNPGNGYPLRLLVPGYEGNMNVKWLHRIELVETPVMAVNETLEYTLLLRTGKAWQFFFPMEVKSIITAPSPGLTLKGLGYYQISGLAWSGEGPISKVEVSADGGKSWGRAALQEPVLSKALTRFRMAWQWDGGPAVLQSRATDARGNVQPTRAALIAQRFEARKVPPVTAFPGTHFNGIASWAVGPAGELRHVYA